jgi:hypothetical protein
MRRVSLSVLGAALLVQPAAAAVITVGPTLPAPPGQIEVIGPGGVPRFVTVLETTCVELVRVRPKCPDPNEPWWVRTTEYQRRYRMPVLEGTEEDGTADIVGGGSVPVGRLRVVTESRAPGPIGEEEAEVESVRISFGVTLTEAGGAPLFTGDLLFSLVLGSLTLQPEGGPVFTLGGQQWQMLATGFASPGGSPAVTVEPPPGETTYTILAGFRPFSAIPVAVPVPAALGLFGVALAGLALARGRGAWPPPR